MLFNFYTNVQFFPPFLFNFVMFVILNITTLRPRTNVLNILWFKQGKRFLPLSSLLWGRMSTRNRVGSQYSIKLSIFQFLSVKLKSIHKRVHWKVIQHLNKTKKLTILFTIDIQDLKIDLLCFKWQQTPIAILNLKIDLKTLRFHPGYKSNYPSKSKHRKNAKSSIF